MRHSKVGGVNNKGSGRAEDGFLHLFIYLFHRINNHPSIHFLPLSPSQSKQAKQSSPDIVLPAYFLLLLRGASEGIPGSDGIFNPSSVFWRLPRGLLPVGRTWNTLKGGKQGASWPDARSTSTGSFQRKLAGLNSELPPDVLRWDLRPCEGMNSVNHSATKLVYLWYVMLAFTVCWPVLRSSVRVGRRVMCCSHSEL